MIRIVKRLDGFYWVYYTTNRIKRKAANPKACRFFESPEQNLKTNP
nr:MAG TPA: hypothetical protein [Caudoviricetes sp.]